MSESSILKKLNIFPRVQSDIFKGLVLSEAKTWEFEVYYEMTEMNINDQNQII